MKIVAFKLYSYIRLDSYAVNVKFLHYFSVLMIFETGWLSAGIVWLVNYYGNCPVDTAPQGTVVGKYNYSAPNYFTVNKKYMRLEKLFVYANIHYLLKRLRAT